MRIRLEEPSDWPALYDLYAAVFGQSAEADLIKRLHPDGDLILSLVVHAEKPLAHIVFSRLVLNEEPSIKGCVLAPLVVAPSCQRQGIGSALLKDGLRRLEEAGFDLVVVLGDPNFYGRFGFSAALARKLKTPYDGSYLQALPLTQKGNGAHGTVSYARAFAELKS